MAVFVRNHGYQMEHVAGTWTSYSKSLVAAVPAARTLVMLVVTDQNAVVTSLSKPLTEGALWQRITPAYPTGGVADIMVEMWSIKTTVEWPSGYTIAAAFSTAVTSPLMSLCEWSGLTQTITASSRSAAFSNPLSQSAAGSAMLPGDVVFVAAAVNGGGNSSTRLTGATGTPSAMTQTGAGGFDYNRPLTYAWELTASGLIVGTPGDFWHHTKSVNYVAGYPAQDVNRNKLGVVAVLRGDNAPPTAPTLTALASGLTVNRAVANRARWTFNDPNPGDSQSAYELRYRIVGATTWTTVTATTPNSWYDFAAGLGAGDYEWQVRTTDSLGAVSPWSTSGFFTAADAPDGPTITYPINGQFVDQAERIDWSIPAQDIYQIRRVADDGAGAPVADPTGTDVYFDTGEVASISLRSLPLNFETNGRPEHVQIRVQDSGLWSPWSSVMVEVSYDAPPAPVFFIDPDVSTGSLLVAITNPAPGVDQVAAVHNDVFVDDGAGELRLATGVPPDGSWRYWTPRSGRDYSTAVRVVAVAANGTTTSSL